VGRRADPAGKPLVGAAGGLLDRALAESGIDLSEVYVTNAVKHFKFEERAAPDSQETFGFRNRACKPWLCAELACIHPEIRVCLGAMAARAVIGKGHRVPKERGHFFEHPMAKSVTATVHPFAILRSPDPERRHRDFEAFVKDSKAIREKLHKVAGSVKEEMLVCGAPPPSCT
jgi:DNA polymerase